MKLSINGEIRQFEDNLTLADIIKKLDLFDKYVAVELNRQIVSYKQYTETLLEDGDVLEIVSFVGGG